MSCLKKVIDSVETECSKSFTNVVLWSDDMGTQLWSRFIFQLLAESMFLNKSLCWFYNEGHHEKVRMDDATIKNFIFRKVKSGQIVVHTEFSDAAMKFVLPIITLYLPKSVEIVDPETIHQAQSIPETLLIYKLVWQINDRGDCSVEFSKTAVDQTVSYSMVRKNYWPCLWLREVQ